MNDYAKFIFCSEEMKEKFTDLSEDEQQQVVSMLAQGLHKSWLEINDRHNEMRQ